MVYIISYYILLYWCLEWGPGPTSDPAEVLKLSSLRRAAASWPYRWERWGGVGCCSSCHKPSQAPEEASKPNRGTSWNQAIWKPVNHGNPHTSWKYWEKPWELWSCGNHGNRNAATTITVGKPWKPWKTWLWKRFLVLHGNSVRVRAVRVLLALQISTVVLCRCGRLPLLACTFLDHFSSLCLRFLPGFALVVVFMEYMEPMQTRKTWKPGDHGETWRNCGIFLGTKHRKHGNQKPGRHHRNPPISYSPFPHAPLPCRSPGPTDGSEGTCHTRPRWPTA